MTHLLDVVPRAHVDQHIVWIREASRHIKRARQRDEERFGCSERRDMSQMCAQRHDEPGQKTTHRPLPG